MKIRGLGIDIVSLLRVKELFRKHPKEKICRLLCPAEKSRFRIKAMTPFTFSKLWAAKEAYFKAQGASWLGIDGFSLLEVKFLPHQRFRVKSLKLGERLKAVTGTYFTGLRWVGAHVILWDKD